MNEDDEIQSHPSPAHNGRIDVTVAAGTHSSNSFTLALPIQQQKTPGREDCWSEGATAVLIEAWGERYLELSRGNLKQKHWKDVADIVSSLDHYTKTPKTDIQCKNRIDTVKKKYKVEKAKIASGAGPSKWRFFDKLDRLIGPTAKMNSVDAKRRVVPMGIPVGVRSSSSAKPNRKRPPGTPIDDSDGDESEPENSADSSDGLPPQSSSYRRPTIHREMRMENNMGMTKKKVEGSSVRELTRAILKLGEAYEQAETAKLQQLVEMEKQRTKFAKDLELQRMQYFMKTQLQLSLLKKRPGNNNNNSDSSN